MPMRPKFRLVYKGVDVSSELAPHLVSCTYTDKIHGEADDIEVTVQDVDGLWRGPWCPETGDICSLSIGYEPGLLVPCGEFEIDEPEAHLSRAGFTFAFRGLSAPVSKALRTKKTKASEKVTLRQIADEIAGRHGLSVTGTVPDVSFERQTQRRERDLEYLARLADEYGAYFTVKGKNLIFARRGELHEQAPVRLLFAASPDYLDASCKRSNDQTYSKARVSYFDGASKKTIDVEVADAKVKNGDTLRLDERVETEAQARAMAQSKLEKANLGKQTVSIKLVGDPYLVAGSVIALAPDFGRWAGRYIIKSSRHHIARTAGYTTHLEAAYVD